MAGGCDLSKVCIPGNEEQVRRIKLMLVLLRNFTFEDVFRGPFVHVLEGWRQQIPEAEANGLLSAEQRRTIESLLSEFVEIIRNSVMTDTALRDLYVEKTITWNRDGETLNLVDELMTISRRLEREGLILPYLDIPPTEQRSLAKLLVDDFGFLGRIPEGGIGDLEIRALWCHQRRLYAGAPGKSHILTQISKIKDVKLFRFPSPSTDTSAWEHKGNGMICDSDLDQCVPSGDMDTFCSLVDGHCSLGSDVR